MSVNKSPSPFLAPPPQAQQSQGHCSGSVTVASGAASNVTVTLPQSLPPPLIRMDPVSPAGPNPFYVKFISGNIRVCQGCKGSLKTTDNRIPTHPFDIAAARSENRPFRDASGTLITPKRATTTVVHSAYKQLNLILLSSLVIPADMKLKLTPCTSSIWSLDFLTEQHARVGVY